MTIEQFGQTIKAKYPEYSNYSDAEIGQKMLEKYPQYQTQVSKPAQPQPQRGVAQKVAGFLGIEKAGQATATALRSPKEINQSANESAQSLLDTNKIIQQIHKLPQGDPRRQHLVEYLKHDINSLGYTPQSEIDPGTALSNKEVLGSFANVGLNAVAPSAFKGGALTQVAKNAGLGAGFGFAGGLNDNKDTKGLIASTALGAGIGAAIPLAGAVISKLRKLTTEIAPESLMNHAIKPTLDELRKSIKYGTDSLGKDLLHEGVKGSPTAILKLTDTRLNETEVKLQELLKNSTGTINRADLEKYIAPTIAKLEKTPGAKSQIPRILEVLNDVPEQMTVAEANVIKRNLYDELRNVAYTLDPHLSTVKKGMKSVARGLKQEIENQSGQPEVVSALNKRLSIYGKLEDRVVDLLARKNRNQLVQLSDIVLSSVGFSHPAAFAALIAKHGASSTRVLTNAAVRLNKLKNVGTGPAGQAIKQITKRALFNLP